VRGEIRLENVRFNYPTKKDVEVLKGISIAIQKNKVIALVGPSGMHIFIFMSIRLWKIQHYPND